jgi:DNA-binding NarL/FixJ family response regulator
VSQTLPRTVLIVENERAVARQVQTCLAIAGFKISRTTSALHEALAAAAEALPDVIVIDIDLVSDAAARRALTTFASQRGVPLVYLSDAADAATIELAAQSHAAAYILKPINERQLASAVLLAAIAAERAPALPIVPRPLTLEEKLQAIAAVVNANPGETATEPVRSRARLRLASPARRTDALTAREREIVELMANGARVVTIARQLELSPHTVRNHLKSVFRKLNLRGQHELFEYRRSEHAG